MKYWDCISQNSCRLPFPDYYWHTMGLTCGDDHPMITVAMEGAHFSVCSSVLYSILNVIITSSWEYFYITIDQPLWCIFSVCNTYLLYSHHC